MTDPAARNTQNDQMLLSATCITYFRISNDQARFQASPIVQAFADEGIRTFSGLLMINEDEITEMTSNPTTPNGARVPCRRVHEI